MKITELLTDTEIPFHFQSLEPENLTANIECISKQTLFFLTEGVSYDKRRLLPYILSKHPLAIVTSDRSLPSEGEIPMLYTKNVRRAYTEAYFRFCRLSDMKMKLIAVTGTNGKTTTATMLYEILRAEKIPTGFIGTGKILLDGAPLTDSFYSMTTPDPELLYPALSKMEAAGCRYAVMEASSHALSLEKLSPLFFEIGIFTNLSEEHLDFHKSMEDYYNAKAKLFGRTRLAILNADDPYARRLSRECACKVITTGALFDADIMARGVEGHGLSGSSYIYKTKGPTFSVELKLAGIYHVYNSMMALAAAIALGILPCRARRAIEALDKISGRMHCIENGEISVFLDYAHTPKALYAALHEARQVRGEKKELWLIFGCGGERDRTKRPKMAKIAEQEADHVILTLDNCRSESPMQILHDTMRGFCERKKIRVITNREKAIRFAILAMQKGDTLIIAGKGHESYSIDKKGYHIFDERKIAIDALKERKGGHTVLYENETDTTALREGN